MYIFKVSGSVDNTPVDLPESAAITALRDKEIFTIIFCNFADRNHCLSEREFRFAA